jgi:ATP-dependent Lhr-like helicase
MFNVRWRWNTGIALAVPRYSGGKKVPPRIQRLRSEDLMGVVFPDGRACFENIAGGKREIPDHPLVTQTIHDCLHEAMDIEALEELLRAIHAGERRIVARDLTEPSPLAAEILTARPYAFLDDAPLEERRTLAVQQRRWLDPDSASDLGQLDPQAIARVREEAWPEVGDADELHDALMCLGFLTDTELQSGMSAGAASAQLPSWKHWMRQLIDQQRGVQLTQADRTALWVAVERIGWFGSAFGPVRCTPDLDLPPQLRAPELDADAALVELLRGRLQGLGPVTAEVLGGGLGLAAARTEQGLLALESEGFVLRGRFTPAAGQQEWCERRLLARIHQYTLQRLRRAVQPVSSATFMRFLLRWQHLLPAERGFGEVALMQLVEQLEGFPAPAAQWERELLATRIVNYDPAMLDSLCLAGRVLWMRAGQPGQGNRSVRAMPVRLLPRRHRQLWARIGWESASAAPPRLLPAAVERVRTLLAERGPSFADELCETLVLDEYGLRQALAVLAATGAVVSDSFDGLRQLMRRAKYPARAGGGSGRWSLTAGPASAEIDDDGVEHLTRVLLRRYGVVFRRLADREPWMPPWWRLLRVLRRLEARGEVRGGRFVLGMAGEQFALPDAITQLRGIDDRDRSPSASSSEEWAAINAIDPLNLTGVTLPGPRVPALPGNRLLLRDGVVCARLQAGSVEFAADLDAVGQCLARSMLLNERAPESGNVKSDQPHGLRSVGS